MSAAISIKRRLHLLEQLYNTVLGVEQLLGKLLTVIRAERANHRAAREEVITVNNAQQFPTVVFDVGGTLHCIQKHLLCDNLLDSLSSLTHGGPIFIDRDPTWFSLVLHVLRYGVTASVHLIPSSPARGAVWREARYYCVDRLMSAASLPFHAVTIVGKISKALCLVSYASTGTYSGRRIFEPNAKTGRLVGYHSSGGETFILTRRRTIWQVRGNGAPRYHITLPLPPAYTLSTTEPAPTSATMAYNPHRHTLVILGWRATARRCGKTTDTWWVPRMGKSSQWEPLPPLVGPLRPGVAVCYAYDRILTVGRNGENTNAVSELAMPSNDWVSCPPMPGLGVCNATIVAWCGEFVVLGGESGGVQLRSVFAYNPVTRCWRQLPSMQHARVRCVAYACISNIIVALGGNPRGAVEYFDGRLWTFMPSLEGINPLGVVLD